MLVDDLLRIASQRQRKRGGELVALVLDQEGSAVVDIGKKALRGRSQIRAG
jgi:hypothetical protein